MRIFQQTPQFKNPKDVFYGWWLVGITVFTLTSVITPIFQGLGFFFVALEREFLWSRLILSIPFSLSRIEGALLGPLEGYLIDRLGSRRMIIIGFILLGIGFILFSFTTGIITYYGSFMIIFAGSGLGGWMPLVAAINHWFNRHRALAMAIGMLGMNLGALLAPLFGQAIDSFGWRTIAFSLGIIVLLLAFPIGFSVRNHPEEYGLLPDGDKPSENIAPDGQSSPTELDDAHEFTVRQALKTVAFWAISAAHGFSAISAVTMSVHIIPALTDRGMSSPEAGTVVLAIGVFGGFFQLLGGFIGDRVPKPPVIAIFIVIQALGMVTLASLNTGYAPYLFALLYGGGMGGRVPLLTAIRGDYFGRNNFATILGISQVPMNLAMMFAPLLAGWAFDTQGSYTIPFLALAALNLLGAALIFLARTPPKKPA